MVVGRRRERGRDVARELETLLGAALRSSVTALSAFTIEVSAAFLSAASQSLSDCLKLCASSAS